MAPSPVADVADVTQDGTDVPTTPAVGIVGPAWAIGDPGAPFGWGRPALPSNWPDLAVHAADIAGLSIRAASARGRMHRYLGTPRQDACGLSWDEEAQRLIVAVCDGVGSLKRSHEAAELVARVAPEIVHAAGGDWSAVFEALSAALISGPGIDRARQMRTIWATTVCIADIQLGADGARTAYLAAVGDSAAWLLRDGRWAHVCGSAKTDGDEEAPASTRTAALPASRIAFTSAVLELSPYDALFLMSDGVADALGAGGGEVGAALAQWWTDPPPPHEFAAQVQFERRGFQDDRTVVGMWIGTQGSSEAQ